MIRTFEVNYFEQYLPSPRHRKMRSRPVKATVNVDLPELTSREAPVAIVQTCPFSRLWIKSEYGTKNRLPYHFYNGKLYVPCRLRNFLCLSPGKRNRWAKPSDLHWHDQYRTHHSLDEGEASLRKYMEQFVMIDGLVCEEIGEPVYVIMSFGLGGNHGLGWGTCLSVDNHYNSNISRDRYYRIDQEREAAEAGWAIAQRRGDTKAEPHFRKRLYDRFEIIDPSAVRRNPPAEAGPGDPFINRVNEITSGGMDPAMAGLAVIAEAFRR